MNQLYADYWEDYLRENPIAATYNGDQRYNNRFGAITSAENRAQSRALAEKYRRAAPNSIRRRCRPKTASVMTCCATACRKCSTACASRPTRCRWTSSPACT
ncbi:hypothetical protein [Duganella sp. P38]|uniref:hypothetical protein n=1 Tax=Duganella sp. P38 TaxID=3423949 RepID=UPI003D7B9452